MNRKLLSVLLMAAIVGGLAATVIAYRSDSALKLTRTQVVQGLLEPAAALLDQNQVLLKELQDASPATPGNGPLEAYLAQIRRDGVPAHAASRKRLDQVSDNQVAIVALLTAYAPHARTPALPAAVNLFRAHATSWRARWGTVMELFMAGGTFATAEMPYPAELADRLREELAAAR